MAALDLTQLLDDRRRQIEDALDRFLPGAETAPSEIHAAMRYAVLSPGKRLRPIITLCVADVVGADAAASLRAACAVEFVHTASLILDDLPCMDDASERRGRLALHRAYSLETALLAAFGLLAEAFSHAAAAEPRDASGPCVCGVLAEAVGTKGLVFGQHLDLSAAGAPMSVAELKAMHDRKAGALFVAAVRMPLLIAHAPEADAARLAQFAASLGLAFQITDDLLDSRDSSEDDNKSTFVTVQSEAEAAAQVEALTREATGLLASFGPKAEPLRQMIAYVASRAR
jgi:geranylgeranyl diphosphate synthase type II